MFERSKTDKRRVLIVDISHLFYKYAFGGAKALSSVIMEDGVRPVSVDTTLPAYTIKLIHRWANGGINPTVICFDSPGSNRIRKAYFIREGMQDVKTEYKAGRDRQSSTFYQGVNITFNLIQQGGVTVLKGSDYEADDLIKASVDRAKQDYPNLPIDVVTGDADLVPLVDDQVSVFLSSRKITWAESKDIEKRNYVQLTPDNYQEYMESLTDYKNLSCPYNTVLLRKLLRGDKSDNIPAMKRFTPTLYRNFVETLVQDGVDVGNIFRYDSPTATICYRHNQEPIPLDIVDSVPNDQKMIKYGEPPCLTKICDVFRKYVGDEEVVEHVRKVYNGINLNGAFTGMPDGFNRRPARLKAPIAGYIAPKLQQTVSVVQINLPVL